MQSTLLSVPRRARVMLVAMLSSIAPACAADRVAVFPFELFDTSQEDDFLPKIRPDETKRLETLTQDLKDRLIDSKKYEVVSLDSLSAEIAAAAPLFKCNGCDADLVKKTGADVAMLGLVQKFSDTLLSVNIEIVDAKTGTVTARYTAAVQGNTDEAWIRAERYIVKNKLGAQGSAP